MVAIKIKNWEELDGKQNGSYKISVFELEDTMCIYTVNAVYMGEIDYRYTPKELVLEQLKLFGFNIEFIKPIKLTREEYFLILYLAEKYPYWGKVIKDPRCNYLMFRPKSNSNNRDEYAHDEAISRSEGLLLFIEGEMALRELMNFPVEQ